MDVRKKKLKKETRLSVLVVLSFILIFSVYSTIDAFSTPVEVKKNVTLFKYEHSGNFRYVVYLKNNSLFDTKTLATGSKIYKELTEKMEMSYGYEFKPKNVAVEGEYTLLARIKTDLWSRDYVIIPKRSFSSSSFEVNFPIDIKKFEEKYDRISKEIGVEAKNPTLLIICNVYVNAKTKYGPVSDTFTHSLSMPLKEKVFDIEGLTLTHEGSVEKEKIIEQTSVVWKRNLSVLASAIFLLLLALFYFLTEGVERTDPVKILEKYKEWIIEAESVPSKEIVTVKSPEDIIKIAEELVKPIIKTGSGTTYCVLDGRIAYYYEISLL